MPRLDPNRPRYAREPDLSLSQAFRIFIRERSPRILLLSTTFLLGSRLLSAVGSGALTWWDLGSWIALGLLHPFVEWTMHVFVLHFRPRTLGGLKLDLPSARYHRAHHVDPWDLRYVAMPLSALLTGFGLLFVTAAVLLPTWSVVHSLMAGALLLGLNYEWCHFLVHTSYRPRAWMYKRIYKFHRLHHFKNENYWMGVSRHLGDYVLGTMKDVREVENSQTAKDLLASYEAKKADPCAS